MSLLPAGRLPILRLEWMLFLYRRQKSKGAYNESRSFSEKLRIIQSTTKALRLFAKVHYPKRMFPSRNL